MIADEHGVESLAGIMGGEASGCDENTTDVLIESALWNEINIAQTGRKLGINSDARYRFERGVDPAFMVPGLELATKLVMEMCGGTPSENFVVGNAFGEDRVIDFPLAEVKRLAGIDVPLAEMKRILDPSRLHGGRQRPCREGRGALLAHRRARQGRHRRGNRAHRRRRQGADDAVRTRRRAAQAGPDHDPAPHPPRQARAGGARHGRSRDVVVHFKAAAELFGGGQAELALANPIASDLSDMRPSLLPGLVAAAQANANRGFADVALFEVGQVFKGDKPEDQLVAASGVRHGFASSKGMGRHWSGSAMTDALDAKADAFAVLAAAGAPMQALQIVPGGASWLHPGRSGTIQIGPQNVLGYFGELHPRTLEALGADGPMIAFEVILDRIPDAKQKPTRAKPVLELSAFQPVSRDFAFIVDRGVKAGDIVRAAQGVDKKLITDVTVFDVYEGKGIDDAKKSVAIAVTIQPREKTLTDQEIDAVAAKIVAEVTKKTGGTLRA